MFLIIRQPNGPLQKKTIKTFVLWDAPQLIKLININHNKYLGSWKSSGQKMVINKVTNKSSTQAMKWDKMCIQEIPWNSNIIVAYWYKRLMFGGYQNITIFVWKANQSGPWQIHISFTQGCVHVFDKSLQWPHVSLKSLDM